MSTLSQFSGGTRPPKVLNQKNAVAGWTTTATIANADSTVGANSTLSGALTANTLKTLLTISGAGSLQYLSIQTTDATARTMRLVLTVDGTACYDYTSTSIASSGAGTFIVGFSLASGAFVGIEDLRFNSSLTVQVASSLTETDKVQIGYRYRTF